VTLLIILVGVLVLLFALGRADRQRRIAIERIDLGTEAEMALRAIGQEPTRCPQAPLGHLAASFPEGWPTAAVDVALEQLETATHERWVVPMREGQSPSCAGQANQSEVGVDSAGAVIWTIAQVGRTTIRLPPWLTPAGTVGDGPAP
jgi:hypothetical protein